MPSFRARLSRAQRSSTGRGATCVSLRLAVSKRFRPRLISMAWLHRAEGSDDEECPQSQQRLSLRALAWYAHASLVSMHARRMYLSDRHILANYLTLDASSRSGLVVGSLLCFSNMYFGLQVTYVSMYACIVLCLS